MYDLADTYSRVVPKKPVSSANYNVNSTQELRNIKAKIFGLLESPDLDKKVNRVFKRYVIPNATAIGIINMAQTAYAGTDSIGDKLMPLLRMLQDLALPLGIIVASWGLIEIILGNFPQGKEKIKYAIIGFVGMFVIPEVFYTIRDVFSR